LLDYLELHYITGNLYQDIQYSEMFIQFVPLPIAFIKTVLTYLLTYLRSWAFLEKLPSLQLLKNFPAFYETRSFTTVFTKALRWSLSWARSIQFISFHPISLRSNLILSTHLRLGLPSGLSLKTVSWLNSSIKVRLEFWTRPVIWLSIKRQSIWKVVHYMLACVGLILQYPRCSNQNAS
jgi:hypothetical protein